MLIFRMIGKEIASVAGSLAMTSLRAKRSNLIGKDCFVALLLAMTNDGLQRC